MNFRSLVRYAPLAIFKSWLIIIVLYTAAITAALPSEDIDLAEGLMGTLTPFFTQTDLGKLLVLALGAAGMLASGKIMIHVTEHK